MPSEKAMKNIYLIGRMMRERNLLIGCLRELQQSLVHAGQTLLKGAHYVLLQHKLQQGYINHTTALHPKGRVTTELPIKNHQ